MKKILLLLFLTYPLCAADFYEADIKGDKITIDTVKDTKDEFTPVVKFNKWNNEEYLRLTIKDLVFKTDEKTTDNKVKITNDDMEINYFVDGDNFKVVLTFYSIPKKNYYQFDLEGYENFDFFYQPPLTAEEIARGDRQAEDAAGSYAVYHKTKKDHIVGGVNYGTGKFLHIYRPKATDAEGKTAWITLNIDGKTGAYRGAIPEEYLKTVSLPFTINDTFGYTSIGSVSTNATWLRASKYTASASGTVSKMTVYLHEDAGSGGNQFYLGIYNDNAGAFGTNVVNASGNVTENTTQWWDVNMSGSIVNGNTYWLVWEEQYLRDYIYRDTTGGTSAYLDSADSRYPLWSDNPADIIYSGSSTFSLYATYTAGGGTPATVAPLILILE